MLPKKCSQCFSHIKENICMRKYVCYAKGIDLILWIIAHDVTFKCWLLLEYIKKEGRTSRRRLWIRIRRSNKRRDYEFYKRKN